MDAVQADGSAVHAVADGSAVQADGSAVQADGSAVQADGSAVEVLLSASPSALLMCCGVRFRWRALLIFGKGIQVQRWLCTHPLVSAAYCKKALKAKGLIRPLMTL